MNKLRTFQLLTLFFVLGAALIPVSASADYTIPAKPACIMVSTTLKNGQPILVWASANATTITDEAGTLTTPLGYRLVSPTATQSYAYTFTGAGGTTLCSTTITVGGATPSVAVATTTTVVNATKAPFVVGTQVLAVSMLPLLSGGTTGAGKSVPVAYIEVTNRGTGTASTTGFTLANNGTANADADVIGFSTSDDKGGSRATIGGQEGSQVSSNESAFIPLAADLAPGQTRIFTIKVILSATHHEVGKTLMYNVSSVGTAGSISGTFPLQGVTWTLNS